MMVACSKRCSNVLGTCGSPSAKRQGMQPIASTSKLTQRRVLSCPIIANAPMPMPYRHAMVVGTRAIASRTRLLVVHWINRFFWCSNVCFLTARLRSFILPRRRPTLTCIRCIWFIRSRARAAQQCPNVSAERQESLKTNLRSHKSPSAAIAMSQL